MLLPTTGLGLKEEECRTPSQPIFPTEICLHPAQSLQQPLWDTCSKQGQHLCRLQEISGLCLSRARQEYSKLSDRVLQVHKPAPHQNCNA